LDAGIEQQAVVDAVTNISVMLIGHLDIGIASQSLKAAYSPDGNTAHLTIKKH
jgi:hypothetical protein